MEPGWYADPFARFEQRFHDGHNWTSHVSTSGEVTSDPPIPDAPTSVPKIASSPTTKPSTVAPVIHVQRRYLCARHGEVTPVAGKAKDADTKVKRFSAGKLTAGVLTGGASMLVRGARSKKDAKTTILVCPSCKKASQRGVATRGPRQRDQARTVGFGRGPPFRSTGRVSPSPRTRAPRPSPLGLGIGSAPSRDQRSASSRRHPPRQPIPPLSGTRKASELHRRACRGSRRCCRTSATPRGTTRRLRGAAFSERTQSVREGAAVRRSNRPAAPPSGLGEEVAASPGFSRHRRPLSNPSERVPNCGTVRHG